MQTGLHPKHVFRLNNTMARQFFIIVGCLALGEIVVWATGIHLPSSIIGMLLLTAFLRLGWVRKEWVSKLSEFLLANLGFFFVPPGVALILYGDIIMHDFLPIVAGTLVSTILVLVATGHMHQMVVKAERKYITLKSHRRNQEK